MSALGSAVYDSTLLVSSPTSTLSPRPLSAVGSAGLERRLPKLFVDVGGEAGVGLCVGLLVHGEPNVLQLYVTWV